jgi:hypothetical protein
MRARLFRYQVIALGVLVLAIPGVMFAGLASTESAWELVDADNEIDERVSLDEDLGVYLVERGTRVIAISNRGPWNNERVVYCPSSQLFEATRSGSKFDIYGHYLYGPAPRGLSRYPTQMRHGDILINTADLQPGLGRRASKQRVREPVGPYCDVL